jgi:CBS domain-containing protein
MTKREKRKAVKNAIAGELMTREILMARADWGVDRLMEFLTDNGISGAPVVGEGDEPVGVVSHTDIVRNGSVSARRTSEPPRFYRMLENVLAPEEIAGFRMEAEPDLTVRDIMTPMVFAVEEDTTVQEVAAMMITGKIHRVFVRAGGKLAGVITAMDLLSVVRDA